LTSHAAPVVVFAYNRPAHLRRCLDSLAANVEAGRTNLVIYCDGPKSDLDAPAVLATLDEARRTNGFASIEVVQRPENLGLATSIITGVTERLFHANRIIVLEDDLVLSPFFLEFMNDGLQRWEDDGRVASIHGYCYPLPEPQAAPFFILGADCLGWATWRRAWEVFDPDAAALLNQIDTSGRAGLFDFGGTYPFTRLLRGVAEGRTQSWAIRWYASTFLHGMVTLYPHESLVIHEGSDGTGTNMSQTSVLDTDLAQHRIPIPDIEPVESQDARIAFSRFFRRMRIRQGLERLGLKWISQRL
jgi:glycosyltransferase involved in cell wall biosynthesis